MQAVALDASQINAIVDAVFGTMLAPAPDSCTSAWRHQPDRISATVSMSGSWNGAVRVECAPAVAMELARRLMPIQPTEVDDDVRDAMGEVANMIGGNLKPIVPRGAQLSVPDVAIGKEPLPGSGFEAAYWVDSQPLWVIVREYAV